jgi:hypothetical protein
MHIPWKACVFAGQISSVHCSALMLNPLSPNMWQYPGPDALSGGNRKKHSLRPITPLVPMISHWTAVTIHSVISDAVAIDVTTPPIVSSGPGIGQAVLTPS